MALDTVATAQATPDQRQPFAELGLKPDEYARIKEILKRRPTSTTPAFSPIPTNNASVLTALSPNCFK